MSHAWCLWFDHSGYRQYVLLLYFPFISEGDLLPVHFLGQGPGLTSHPSLSWPSVTIHKLLNPKPLFPAQMSPRSARYTHWAVCELSPSTLEPNIELIAHCLSHPLTCEFPRTGLWSYSALNGAWPRTDTSESLLNELIHAFPPLPPETCCSSGILQFKKMAPQLNTGMTIQLKLGKGRE